ncbi:uncharacterized protein LOC134194155 isoform X2 [Corticium candelabrum]|uniref:uncharacterized protein LOC134194155 isoform X2 n=1 Tax=Corticium candelabrum TaxID=121492 RepID=UPI002E25DED4|nr:uncharacterized protein LOC134194155 isoform X2 [Corticium candelabrum]
MSCFRFSTGLSIIFYVSTTSQNPTSQSTTLHTQPPHINETETQSSDIDSTKVYSDVSEFRRVIGVDFMRCEPLVPIANAKITMSTPFPRVRTTAKIVCDAGSTIVGSDILECNPMIYNMLETGGWSAEAPVCLPVVERTNAQQCQLPQLPPDSVFLHLGKYTPINHLASYVCTNTDLVIFYPLLCTRNRNGYMEFMGSTQHCTDKCNGQCAENAICATKIPLKGQSVPTYNCECKKPEYIGTGYKCTKNPCQSTIPVCGRYEKCDLIDDPMEGMANYECNCVDGFFKYNDKCAPVL